MTQIFKSGGPILVALAGILGWCESASAQSMRKAYSRDDLARAIQDNRDADNKLKYSFQQLVVACSQGVAVNNELAAVNHSLLDSRITRAVRNQLEGQARKLEADLNKRKAAVKPLESSYRAQQAALLKNLNKSCVPVLKGLTNLESKTLESIDSLFDLFVLSEQREIPELMIGASFVDQDVWKETCKCLARLGEGQLAELKKFLVSKSTPAKYAAASAIGELSEQVPAAERYHIQRELLRMSETLTKAKSNIDSSERRSRQKILDTALEALRSKENK